jgi:hypothetical protein
MIENNFPDRDKSGRNNLKNKSGVLNVVWGAIQDWWDEWIKWFWLGLILTACWATVLLGPPATFAFVYAAHYSLQEGKSSRIGDLIRMARTCAAVSWLWMVINLVVIAVFILDFPFFFSSDSPTWQLILQAIYCFFVFLWWSIQYYALPFLFQQEHKHLGRALYNGLLTALAFPLFSLFICGLGLALMVLSIYLVLPLALGIPGLVITLGVHAVDERLEKIGLRNPEKKTDDFSIGARRNR